MAMSQIKVLHDAHWENTVATVLFDGPCSLHTIEPFVIGVEESDGSGSKSVCWNQSFDYLLDSMPHTTPVTSNGIILSGCTIDGHVSVQP
jgi:hypothetical protein